MSPAATSPAWEAPRWRRSRSRRVISGHAAVRDRQVVAEVERAAAYYEVSRQIVLRRCPAGTAIYQGARHVPRRFPWEIHARRPKLTQATLELGLQVGSAASSRSRRRSLRTRRSRKRISRYTSTVSLPCSRAERFPAPCGQAWRD